MWTPAHGEHPSSSFSHQLSNKHHPSGQQDLKEVLRMDSLKATIPSLRDGLEGSCNKAGFGKELEDKLRKGKDERMEKRDPTAR